MRHTVWIAFAFILMLAPSLHGVSGAAPQDDTATEVWFGDQLAVSYRAHVDDDWLIVAASHESGWHTYSMDNVIRAREKSGRAEPETEIPTVITPLDGLTIEGAWRQSEPIDLSTPDIQWFTWGFEGTSFFAVRLAEANVPSSVQVDAQACTESLCAWVDALVVPVAPIGTGESGSVDPESLVAVATDVMP